MEPGTLVRDCKKDDSAEVAQTGFDAMRKGDAEATYALKNKLFEAVATVLPDTLFAAAHRKMSEPMAGCGSVIASASEAIQGLRVTILRARALQLWVASLRSQ